MVVRYDPFADLFTLARDVSAGSRGGTFGATDVHRTDEAFVLHVDLPGVRQDDVHLTADDGQLAITVTRHAPAKDEQVTWLRQERRHGEFRRTYTLPETVDVEMITASMEHGVLEVRIPHAPERQPREIPIAINA